MAETFMARMKLKGTGFGRYPRAFTFEDVDTGEIHYVFPSDLSKMIEGMVFEREWTNTSKGGYEAIRPVKQVLNG